MNFILDLMHIIGTYWLMTFAYACGVASGGIGAIVVQRRNLARFGVTAPRFSPMRLKMPAELDRQVTRYETPEGTNTDFWIKEEPNDLLGNVLGDMFNRDVDSRSGFAVFTNPKGKSR